MHVNGFTDMLCALDGCDMSDLNGFSLLLVDDHPLFRDGLMLALGQHEPALQVHAVGSGQEAEAFLHSRIGRVDLVLVDFRLPGDDGLAVVSRLRQRFADVGYALMSGVDDTRLAARARDAGLLGYFPKSLDVTTLVEGLRDLAQGQSYFAPFAAAPQADADPLTPRQREILDMVARGATNKEIAQLLQIAPHTVKNHLGQIFGRLGAANRTQAAQLVQGLRDA
jgi:two-component system, NarL family, nitrate/nitrite response regulator NarL